MENISADQSFVLINLQLHYLSLSLKFICINFPFICICNLITRNMVIVFNSWGPPYFPSTLSWMFQFRVRSLSAVTLAKLKLDFELVEIVDNCSRMDNILNHVIHQRTLLFFAHFPCSVRYYTKKYKYQSRFSETTNLISCKLDLVYIQSFKKQSEAKLDTPENQTGEKYEQSSDSP